MDWGLGAMPDNRPWYSWGKRILIVRGPLGSYLGCWGNGHWALYKRAFWWGPEEASWHVP